VINVARRFLTSRSNREAASGIAAVPTGCRDLNIESNLARDYSSRRCDGSRIESGLNGLRDEGEQAQCWIELSCVA